MWTFVCALLMLALVAAYNVVGFVFPELLAENQAVLTVGSTEILPTHLWLGALGVVFLLGLLGRHRRGSLTAAMGRLVLCLTAIGAGVEYFLVPTFGSWVFLAGAAGVPFLYAIYSLIRTGTGVAVKSARRDIGYGGSSPEPVSPPKSRSRGGMGATNAASPPQELTVEREEAEALPDLKDVEDAEPDASPPPPAPPQPAPEPAKPTAAPPPQPSSAAAPARPDEKTAAVSIKEESVRITLKSKPGEGAGQAAPVPPPPSVATAPSPVAPPPSSPRPIREKVDTKEDKDGLSDKFAPIIPLENVQFTAYRPSKIRPKRWFRLLVFAHLDDKPLDAPEHEPHPLVRVQNEAEAILGEDVAQYAPMTKDSRVEIPDHSELSLVPLVPGVEFSPRTRQFKWERGNMVHREEFLFQTAEDRVGQALHGQLSIYLGALIISEIRLSFAVVPVDAPEDVTPPEASTSQGYRKIFASYAHADTEIVEQMEALAESMGDRFLRDVVDLRSGDIWQQRLLEMINEANIFQLFWSEHSAKSVNVEKEWRHALALNRERFIRPVYWEMPCPQWPRELSHIHFGRLFFGAEDLEESGMGQVLRADQIGEGSKQVALKVGETGTDAEEPFAREIETFDALAQEAGQDVVRSKSEAGFLAGEAFKTATGEKLMNSMGMELRCIVEPGVDPYWIGAYQVTQSDWQMFMKNNPSHFTASGPNAPVERVSWEEAMRFCRELTEMEAETGHLPEGYIYTLPSEAQWETACRAGTTTAYAFGDRLTPELANIDRRLGHTVEVGSYSPNAWGIHDMHGNVWEWCSDVYQPDPSNPVDESDLALACYRSVRGGSWYSTPAFCRSDSRLGYVRGYRDRAVGFRVALVRVQ